MDTAWQDCQCQCDAGKFGNRSPVQVLAESGVLDAVTYYDSSGELIDAFEDDDVSYSFFVALLALVALSPFFYCGS